MSSRFLRSPSELFTASERPGVAEHDAALIQEFTAASALSAVTFVGSMALLNMIAAEHPVGSVITGTTAAIAGGTGAFMYLTACETAQNITPNEEGVQ